MNAEARILLCVVSGLLSLSLAAATAPLPCTPAAPGDPQPWEHNSSVLASFPADSPRPTYIGDFRDSSEGYRLQLWRDKTGYFGEISHPALPSDSPTSRLYDVVWNERLRLLSFRAELPNEGHTPGGAPVEITMVGTLEKGQYKVAVSGLHQKAIVLHGSRGDAFPWVSRAQFDCAMTLWHRY